MKKWSIIIYIVAAALSFQVPTWGMNACMIAAGKAVGTSSGGCSGGNDGEIGTNTTTYASNINATVAGTIVRASYAPTTGGMVTYCHATIRYLQATSSCNFAILDASGNNLVDASLVAGTNANPQQMNFLLDTAYCLASGTTYQLAIGCDGSDITWDVKSYATTGGTTYTTTEATIGASMPAAITGGTSGSQIAVFHCDNTATY